MTITNKVLKVTKIRNTEYYDMTYVFDDLYAKSKWGDETSGYPNNMGQDYSIKKRLNLEISEDKSKITNLRKEYSEFLGFKMKVYQKGNKWKVKSRMCDKAYDRTRKELKEAMDVI